VIGSRLVPLLVEADHEVIGMTRSRSKVAALIEVGAEPVVCDVFDAAGLAAAVARAQPDVVMHQLTDLPDDFARFEDFATSHNRIRRVGTRNLVAAALAVDVSRFIAQSVAWALPGDGGAAVEELEKAVLSYPGVVLRYGQFYGPGTYHPARPPDPPRIHVDEAARRTVASLDAVPGVFAIVDD